MFVFTGLRLLEDNFLEIVSIVTNTWFCDSSATYKGVYSIFVFTGIRLLEDNFLENVSIVTTDLF